MDNTTQGHRALSARVLTDQDYQRFLAALLTGNRKEARNVIANLLDKGEDPLPIYEGIFRSSLYRIGELWERNTISVATEHMATAICEELLHMLSPLVFQAPRVDKSVIVSCAANEYHQLGGRIVSDYFELHGWDAYFLGANTPVYDLLRLIEEKQPDMVALSLTVFFNMPALLEMTKQVHQQFPSMPLLVGGQAFEHTKVPELLDNPKIHIAAGLDQIPYLQQVAS